MAIGDILRNNQSLVGEKGMWSYWRWMRESSPVRPST